MTRPLTAPALPAATAGAAEPAKIGEAAAAIRSPQNSISAVAIQPWQ